MVTFREPVPEYIRLCRQVCGNSMLTIPSALLIVLLSAEATFDASASIREASIIRLAGLLYSFPSS